LEKLEHTNPKQLKFSWKKKNFIPIFLSVALSILVLLIPYDVFAQKTEIDEAEARAEWVGALLEDLRAKSEQFSDEEVKSAVDEILDELEEELKNAQSELQEAEDLAAAQEKLQELIDQYLTRIKIGEALQRFSLTRPLGEAISPGDTEAVSAAMKNLFQEVDGKADEISTLATNIREALEASGVASSDALYSALFDFSTGLGMNTAANSNQLQTDFDVAEAAIIAALEAQKEIEYFLKSIAENLEEVAAEALGEEEEEGEKPEGEDTEGEKPEGEKSEGEKPEGEMPEDMPEDMPEGELPEGDFGGEGTSTMTEPFYDPISGAVTYGDVYASYYYQYLKQLSEGEISEDLEEIIDNYFELISE